MKQLQDLLETGVYETLAPSKAMTVHNLLKELNLSLDGLLTVLVNGKKARLEDEITPKDEICMIPMIAGGSFISDEEFDSLDIMGKSRYLHGLHARGQRLVQDCQVLIEIWIKKRLNKR